MVKMLINSDMRHCKKSISLIITLEARIENIFIGKQTNHNQFIWTKLLMMLRSMYNAY